MTVLTPAYAHAFQSLFMSSKTPVQHLGSELQTPCSQAKSRYQPNIRTNARQSDDDYKGWPFFTHGGTHKDDGATVAGLRAIARSPHGVRYIMFGPVITAEAHVANARAKQHKNNTAELSGIIESLWFLSSIGHVPRGSQAFFFLILNTLPTSGLVRCYHGRTSASG